MNRTPGRGTRLNESYAPTPALRRVRGKYAGVAPGAKAASARIGDDVPDMYAQVKRIIDVLVSAGLILLLTPVWLLAVLAVKLGSPGPILFRQVRGGWRGRPFESYKFRTMRADHVHDPREIVPLSHPGVTGIGRLLRRLKIDELPQLFNVLKGDMSLVGPRPTLMDQVAAYDDYKRQRLLVRPGLTGLAQVNGNAQISWDERIHYDVYYVHHLTPWMDLYILLKTILVVILGEDRFSRPFAESPFARSEKSEVRS